MCKFLEMSRVEVVEFFQKKASAAHEFEMKKRRTRLRKPHVAHAFTMANGHCLVITANKDDEQPEHWFFEHNDENAEPVEIRDGYFTYQEVMASAMQYLIEITDVKKPNVWTRRDGTRIKVTDMSDRHVLNAIARMRRMGGDCKDPDLYAMLCAEANRRNII